jgi:hypothetical protein
MTRPGGAWTAGPLGADPTSLILLGFGLVLVFFAVRPELWARLWFARVDPRPAAILRIGFGLAVAWTLLEYLPRARQLFSDEGLWLPAMARARFGEPLRRVWDPEAGFEHWWSLAYAMSGNFSILHFRSEPWIVFALYGALMTSLGLMVLGLWTRCTTVASWALAAQLYRHNPFFYSSADYVAQIFLFLGMFCRWGEAYSLDSWRRRRRLVLGGAACLPAVRPIPVWPLRLMALQLTVLYTSTGLLKSGPAWREGSAIYYALNLDNFYRVPAQGLVTWLQWLGVLPLLTWLTRAWEVGWPLAIAAALLAGYESDRRSGVRLAAGPGRRRLSWAIAGAAWAALVWALALLAPRLAEQNGLDADPDRARTLSAAALIVGPGLVAATYRLARRRAPRPLRRLLGGVLPAWLGFGLLLHLGIGIGLNIGTFPQLMMASYACLLTGPGVDRLRAFLLSRPLGRGEGPRPLCAAPWGLVLAPIHRLRYRVPRERGLVRYHPDELGARRAALLRLWDPAGRLTFRADRTIPSDELCVEFPGLNAEVVGGEAGVVLARTLPGLWWLGALSLVPGLRRPVGGTVLRLLGHGATLPRGSCRIS